MLRHFALTHCLHPLARVRGCLTCIVLMILSLPQSPSCAPPDHVLFLTRTYVCEWSSPRHLSVLDPRYHHGIPHSSLLGHLQTSATDAPG